MNNLNKTKILNATIELANEIRKALLEDKEELMSLYKEVLELAPNKTLEDRMRVMGCKFKVDSMLSNMDASINMITELEERVCKHYRTDSYSEFYGRALENMNSMEGVYRNQTGFAFS